MTAEQTRQEIKELGVPRTEETFEENYCSIEILDVARIANSCDGFEENYCSIEISISS